MSGPFAVWAVGLLGTFGLLAGFELGIAALWSAVIGDRDSGSAVE